LTFGVQNARSYEPPDVEARRKSQRERELLATRLLVLVSDSFNRGLGPVQSHVLFETLAVSPRFGQRVLADLVETQLLVETAAREQEEASFLPARPIQTISVADVVRAMRQVGAAGSRAEVPVRDDDVLGQRVTKAITQAEQAVDGALGGVTLADLLDGRSSAREAPAAV
jgi:DNA-binding IscR family transcriptional regulator